LPRSVAVPGHLFDAVHLVGCNNDVLAAYYRNPNQPQ
jgi:hypothetical protein